MREGRHGGWLESLLEPRVVVALLAGALLLGPMVWLGLPAALSDDAPGQQRGTSGDTLVDEVAAYVLRAGDDLQDPAEPDTANPWRLADGGTVAMLHEQAHGLELARSALAREMPGLLADDRAELNWTVRTLGNTSEILHITSEAVDAGIVPPDDLAPRLADLGERLERLGDELHGIYGARFASESVDHNVGILEEAVLPAVRASGTIEEARLVEVDGERWINVTLEGAAPMPGPARGSGWTVKLCTGHMFNSQGEEISDMNESSGAVVAAQSCMDWRSSSDASDDRVPERRGPGTLLLPVYLAEERDGGALTVEVDVGPIHTRHSCPMPQEPGPMTCAWTEVEDRR